MNSCISILPHFDIADRFAGSRALPAGCHYCAAAITYFAEIAPELSSHAAAIVLRRHITPLIPLRH
jgi:hypothetical protein